MQLLLTNRRRGRESKKRVWYCHQKELTDVFHTVDLEILLLYHRVPPTKACVILFSFIQVCPLIRHQWLNFWLCVSSFSLPHHFPLSLCPQWALLTFIDHWALGHRGGRSDWPTILQLPLIYWQVQPKHYGLHHVMDVSHPALRQLAKLKMVMCSITCGQVQ